jgi:hypothetical protein
MKEATLLLFKNNNIRMTNIGNHYGRLKRMDENLDSGKNLNQPTDSFWKRIEERYKHIETVTVKTFGETCGWIGLVLIHGSTIPITLAALAGQAVLLPPISMILLIWSGLFLFFIRSAIQQDRLYMLSNGIGFFLQSIMLAFLVFK